MMYFITCSLSFTRVGANKTNSEAGNGHVDAVTAWISSGLSALGLGVVPVAAAAMALSGIWLWNGLALARRDRALEVR